MAVSGVISDLLPYIGYCFVYCCDIAQYLSVKFLFVFVQEMYMDPHRMEDILKVLFEGGDPAVAWHLFPWSAAGSP